MQPELQLVMATNKLYIRLSFNWYLAYMTFIRILRFNRVYLVLIAVCLVALNYFALHLLDQNSSTFSGSPIDEKMSEMSKALLSFGVFADLQYSDIDNKMNYEQTHMRYYRDSLNKLKRMLDFWTEKEPVQFLLNLGDLIDGHNKAEQASEKALNTMLSTLAHYKGNIYHTWGNHDLYNFYRAHLDHHSQFNTAFAVRKGRLKPDGPFNSPEGKAYYSFSPHDRLRIIMMDHYEFSPLGREEDDHLYVKSKAYLRSRNPNKDLNSPIGLFGAECRFVLFNAGVSQTQLKWLDIELSDAKANKQWVIVAGHVPVYGKATTDLCLLWNFDAVLNVLHGHSNVVAYLAGHDHDGGSGIDGHGVLHLTLNGVVEADPGTSDYATVHLTNTHLHIRGYGRVPSITRPLPKL